MRVSKIPNTMLLRCNESAQVALSLLHILLTLLARSTFAYSPHGRVRFELGYWSRLAKFPPTLAGQIGFV